METLASKEMISRLINKIQIDWQRANGNGSGLSRIDKDILIDDLKKVYDLVYELDVAKAHLTRQPLEQLREQHTVSADIEPEIKPDIPQETIEDRADEIEPKQVDEIPEDELPEKDAVPFVDSKEKDETPEIVQEEFMAVIEVEVEVEIEGLGVETENLVQEDDRPAPVEAPLEITADESHESKSALDLFSATKTLADVYQNDNDNSLAAKITQHKISDIKAAIGINDKFLFINEIFKGEMSAYNQHIEKLNQTEDFHEALHLIDEVKMTNGSEENQTAFSKLIEIAKRKFL